MTYRTIVIQLDTGLIIIDQDIGLDTNTNPNTIGKSDYNKNQLMTGQASIVPEKLARIIIVINIRMRRLRNTNNYKRQKMKEKRRIETKISLIIKIRII